MKVCNGTGTIEIPACTDTGTIEITDTAGWAIDCRSDKAPDTAHSKALRLNMASTIGKSPQSAKVSATVLGRQ